MVVESHLQTQRAAIKMLHERIMVLVKYVTEVIAGNFPCRKPAFFCSERDDPRSGDQGPCRFEVVVRAYGFSTGH